jgi:hypothetical protein
VVPLWESRRLVPRGLQMGCLPGVVPWGPYTVDQKVGSAKVGLQGGPPWVDPQGVTPCGSQKVRHPKSVPHVLFEIFCPPRGVAKWVPTTVVHKRGIRGRGLPNGGPPKWVPQDGPPRGVPQWVSPKGCSPTCFTQGVSHEGVPNWGSPKFDPPRGGTYGFHQGSPPRNFPPCCSPMGYPNVFS